MPEKLEASSNFANKLWNAAKFVLMNIEEENMQPTEIDVSKLEYEDKWILSKLNTLIRETTTNLDNFDMGVYAQKIYDFTWNEFCDWYIEIVKSRLYNKEESGKESRIVAQKVLLYNEDESIMISNWPTAKKEYDFEVEEEHIEEIKKLIVQIRNIRTNMNIHPSKKSELIFVTEDKEYIKCWCCNNEKINNVKNSD